MILQALKDRVKSDEGFMGVTHALSALGIGLALIAFAPNVMQSILQTDHAWVYVLFTFAFIGASLIPDLDNTNSRAKSDLGVLGSVLSVVFRGSSTFLQTTIRTKKDDKDPNPHRGAWHTIPASIFLGVLVMALSQIGGDLNIPGLGSITVGTLIALFVTVLLTHLTLSSLAKKLTDKIKKSADIIGDAIVILLSVIITFVSYAQIPDDINFWWLGVAITGGSIVHILGDCFTTAGAPIMFPLSAQLRGKYWWTTRFSSMKAGGSFEKVIFVPFFIILSIISISVILYNSFV